MNNNLYKKNKNKSISSSLNLKESDEKNDTNKQKDVEIQKIQKIPKKYYEFPKGDHVNCIGPCYPKNTLIYNPLTLHAIKSKNYNICPIEKTFIKELKGVVEYDTCKIDKQNDNENYENYDTFADVIRFATTDDAFLKQIYNISNILEVNQFEQNNINELPILSQKRLINCIYQVYKDNDTFPSENFINITKNILKELYNINAKSKKIIDYIMNNKYKTNWPDLFDYLAKKLSNK